MFSVHYSYTYCTRKCHILPLPLATQFSQFSSRHRNEYQKQINLVNSLHISIFLQVHVQIVTVTRMSLPDYLTSSPPPIPVPTTVRLQALYASTSAQRQSNPTGYSANVSWWSLLIEELLRSGYLGEDHLAVKVDDSLLGKLEWNGGKPKGIGGVVVSPSSTLLSA